MNELHYTTRTAPARLLELGRAGHSGEPLKPGSVGSLARTHGIGQKFGRDYQFTEADLARMAALPGPGNPNWTQKSDDEGGGLLRNTTQSVV